MKTDIYRFIFPIVISLALISCSRYQVSAGTVTWTIDPTQSVVRLNLPDQTLIVDGTSVLVQIRNSNNAAWSDAGGRASFVTGTLATNYSETASSASLTYLQGSHSASAIQFGSFRPNPAAFNPSNTNADNPDGQFSDTSGAPAAFAAKIRGAVGFLTLDLAFLAIRDVQYDFGGTALLSGSDGSFTGGQSQTTLGLASGSASIDGLTNLLVGQVIPDINNADISDLLGSDLQTNSASLQIANVGSLQRRLTQQINTPLTFDVDGTLVNGFINGQIVAFATLVAVPEPSSIALFVLGLGFVTRRLKDTTGR